MQLLVWLGMADGRPSERELSKCRLLRLRDVARIIDQLHRTKLIPTHAKPVLVDAAISLRLPRAETPRGTEAAFLDADALVCRWMELWGTWDIESMRGPRLVAPVRETERLLRGFDAGPEAGAETSIRNTRSTTSTNGPRRRY